MQELIYKFFIDNKIFQLNMYFMIKLMPHQVEAIEYVRCRQFSYLGDDMGLGKTYSALGAIKALDCKISLIICPAYLRLNWKYEAEKMGFTDIHIMTGRKDKLKHSELTICGFDHTVLKNISAQCFYLDMIIVDEAHNFGGKKAKRTKTLLGNDTRIKRPLIDQSFRTLFMSGSPILNRPEELWPVLQKVYPELWDFYAFAYRYCGAYQGKFGLITKGASNLKELREKFLKPFMLRRTKDQILDLPEKIHTIIPIQAPKELKVLKTLSVEDYYESTNAIGEYAELRNRAADLKFDVAVEHISEIYKQTDSVIVFAYHRNIVKKLAEHFECDFILGDTSAIKRQNMVAKFQKEGGIIIGNYKAMGTGFTLTNTSNVVLVELDYSPLIMNQAIDRAHRIGQTKTVNVHILLWNEGVEWDLYKQVKKKMNTFNKLFL